MRAAVMRNKKIVPGEIPSPEPRAGEALVKTLACGICGSDLHALKFVDQLGQDSLGSGDESVMDLSRGIVMGHEFCAEVVDYGPNTPKRLKPSTRVCSMPLLPRPEGVVTVGYSNANPGGFAEYMRLNESFLLEVPNGLSIERAALTEPMSVGYHAVQKARVEKDDAPLVIGCGPVGLSVILALKLKGVHPIVAADFSPRRRELAEKVGADIIIDPKEISPYESWKQTAAYSDPSKAPPLTLWMKGGGLRPALIFECVGVPGVINTIMAETQPGARIVVVGVCMEEDRFRPMSGINKELNIQFVLGYSGEEFAATLQNLAEGKINADALITGKVGVEGVAGAFEELASPERHAKILVEPWRN
jgi:threonine dehydrogenase-like Zn-dependent dehydrogenase